MQVQADADGGPPNELDALPPGSFGAGGWAPGGNGKYPRLSPQEAVQAKADFRDLLIKRHHSVLRAWRAFDTDGNGRLSIFEFMRGCQDLGVNHGALQYGGRQLWDALDMDRSGFISLEEIDEELAKMLASLAATIWVTCGSLDSAWKNVFNRKNFSFRVPKDEWVRACQEIGYPGDAAEIFEALRADLATVGLSRQEFELLSLWFAKEPAVARSPLHDGAELEHLARIQDPHDVRRGPSAKELRDNAGKAKKHFKKLLIDSYGNFLRAWREGLDRDHNGVLDYKEFKTACTDIGYPGTRRELWNQLDVNLNGSVSLREIDEPTAIMVETIYHLAEKRYGSWEAAWYEVFDKRGDDRVKVQAFIDGCRLLGYKGNPERLFELLDLDRTRYLELRETDWLEAAVRGEEVPEPPPPREECGDVVITGRYRTFTKAMTRKSDWTTRDQRVMKKRFEGRARGEIPGSSAAAGTYHFGASGFGQTSHSLGFGSSGSLAGSMAPSRLGSTWPGPGASGESWMSQASMHKASSSPALVGGKEKHVSRDPVGLRPAPGFPEYMKEPIVGPPGSLIKDPQQRMSLDRPLAPQCPGKGGWPVASDRLSDPEWGGTAARASGTRPSTRTKRPVGDRVAVTLPAAQDPLAQGLLARATVSTPNLHSASLTRWRQAITA